MCIIHLLYFVLLETIDTNFVPTYDVEISTEDDPLRTWVPFIGFDDSEFIIWVDLNGFLYILF